MNINDRDYFNTKLELMVERHYSSQIHWVLENRLVTTLNRYSITLIIRYEMTVYPVKEIKLAAYTV